MRISDWSSDVCSSDLAKRDPLESLRLDLACLEEAFGDADCQADQQERPEPEGEQMIAAEKGFSHHCLLRAGSRPCFNVRYVVYFRVLPPSSSVHRLSLSRCVDNRVTTKRGCLSETS